MQKWLTQAFKATNMCCCCQEMHNYAPGSTVLRGTRTLSRRFFSLDQ